MILTKGSLEEREQMDTSVLKAVPLFKDIDAEDLEALGQLMSETTLKRGDSLFRSSDDGRENLIAVLGPGEIIGELSLFDVGARSSTVAAIAPTRLVSLSHKDMMSFINQHPDMAITMLRELARRLRNTNEQMADLVFSDVPGRVAKALIDLANRFGERTPEGIYVAHDLTQEELAHLVGASRETVNKSLADFVSRGWIRLEGRAVLLIELARLQRRAH